LRILFDKNVPVGLRRLLPKTWEIRTVVEMQWSDQLENGALLKAAESGFDILVTSDQNIRYQQNLTGRKLALVVLGSNISRLCGSTAQS
jgi:predicted nuclease of predicted toxin-antitoxin system